MATQTIPTPQPSRGANPQLKSLVYSKYRELLGSYNGKANEILQSYPAYMVKEDKGFDFVDNYGGPPQSTIGSSARRIQAQLPAEPPACVQNAMMRRDKQPFTYTPGGIDLSQIKSPRMAKRISRNAQSEGVSNQPKVSPLAQNNNTSNSSSSQPAVSPAATLGAAAMGMPFQVFPTGPPAPPPPPPPSVARKPTQGQTNGNSAPAPPPPPPPPVLSVEKKTPVPQSFEPPPMGCRPEIKIPPNPMANLRKAPRPQPKNDFWIEEYRNEKRNDLPNPVQQMPVYSTREADEEVAKNTHNRTDQLTVRNDSPNRSPSPSNLTKSLENGSQVSTMKTPPVYSQSPVPPNLPPPITPTKLSQPSSTLSIDSTSKQTKEQSPKPRQKSPPLSTPPSPPTNGTSVSTQNTAPTTITNSTTVKPPTAQKPAPQALGSLYIPPPHEAFANSKQSLLTQTSPPWMSSRQNSVKEQPEWVHKEDPDYLGSKVSSASKSNSNEFAVKSSESITAAPPSPPKPAPVPKPQQSPQPTTSVSRPQTIELPSPAISQTHYIQLQNPKVTPQPIVQQAPVGTMPTLRSYQQTPVYVQNQEYSPQPATTQKERIIPIQMEQSPIKTPASAPSFAPPPYYSPGPQYNTVQSPLTVGYPGPHSGFTTPTAMYSNPNHFVNQGYNNINYPPASPQHPMYQQHHQHYQQQPPPMQQQQQHQQMMHQQRMQQQTPTQQPGGVRIIPIKVDNDNETTATTVRGPLSQTPAIIQSGDHRYIIHDIPLEAKLRFLKNRLSDPRSHNNPQAWNGNSAPNQSRSFRVLQQITDTMEDAESGSTPKPSNEQQQQQQQHQQSNSNVEGTENQMRRLQLSKDDKALMNRVKNQGSSNRSNQMFVQNRGNASESEDETARQYVPPSEQRVEEPKKYTGSAIPSRSFKMLQAMTQSDAPADTNASEIEGSQNLPCNGEIRYSPYPYPLQPHYCCNPNWHYYDPNNPQFYPHAPPPPPHHAPGYYYPPPPPPPHGHYDRNSYYAGYMSPHPFYYPQEPCSPCTPPPYYQVGQPQIAYCENVVPESPTHSYVITTPPPRLIVTPIHESADSDVESTLSDFNNPLTRSQSSLQRLSERLANFSTSPEKMIPNVSESVVRCSPSSPLNERYRTFEESTSSAPSSQSECSDSEEEGRKSLAQTSAITAAIKEPIQNGTDGDEEHDNQEDEESSDESEDETTVGYESSPQEHLPHQLSVIFEEESVYSSSANASRRASVCSNSSTLSDCSSTLANDLDDDDRNTNELNGVQFDRGNHTDDDIDRLDDEELTDEGDMVSKETHIASTTKHDSEGVIESEEESATEEEDGEEEDESTDQEEIESTSTADKTVVDTTKDNEDDDSTESEDEYSEAEETETESDDEEEDDNAMNSDVTVTITIPSMSSKSLNDCTIDNNSVIEKDDESKPTFTVDYEDDSNVSVCVSLSLKAKPATSEEPNKEYENHNDVNTQDETENEKEEDDEEIDFWSQIGEEDEMSRPSRSYSRDFWSSREASVDRDGEWNQENDEDTNDDGDTDFWSSENGPTEAIDLWKKDPIVETFLDRQKNENTTDSIDFWQSENERMFNSFYSKRNQDRDAEKDCALMDENNNSSTWEKIEKLPDAELNAIEDKNDDKVVAEKSATSKDSEEEVTETESSEEESEDDSEEYETTNTSKEESDVEENGIQNGDNSNPTVTEAKLPEIVLKKAPVAEKTDHKCNGILSAINTITKEDDKKLSVRDRISIFENQTNTPSLEVPLRQKSSESSIRSRPSSMIKTSAEESEMEDDSGMTSDVSKPISEVETDSECFPEMRKMTRYQRAATHSRLFKLLQDESNNGDSDDEEAERLASIDYTEIQAASDERNEDHPRHSSFSKYNGSSFDDSSSTSNTASDRRDRLSLPIRHQSSSGIESMSSSTSSASPVSGVTNEKLAEELVQSLLMKKKGRLFRNLPLEKLHAAAMKILQEDLESNGTLSSIEDNILTVDSTPALTPQEFKSEYQNSYADYYDTWNESTGKSSPLENGGPEAVPSKAFRNLQDSTTRKSNSWSARCPRVLSSKSISRLADVRETDASETSAYPRSRPLSRASNHSPYPTFSGLIEESPSGSRSPYKQSKHSNF
ncbi:FK506-binding protein 5 isoform X4 [Aedes aegypti]|uniref:Uncharacterized protein n=1 Tax=Aedes aegypti TaxID=7159 RepID=A0A6I8TAF9_AEDAE|nr:FK506-binding protein 5 isoform X4 [Aedes aegypti]